MILSAAMMLDHSFHMKQERTRVEQAVEQTLQQGFRTKDLFTNKQGEKLLGTKEMGEKIVSFLN